MSREPFDGSERVGRAEERRPAARRGQAGDQHTFEELARVLASPMPRRRAFKLALATVVAAGLGRIGLGAGPAYAGGCRPGRICGDGCCDDPFTYCCGDEFCCELVQECCGFVPGEFECCSSGSVCCGGQSCCDPAECHRGQCGSCFKGRGTLESATGPARARFDFHAGRRNGSLDFNHLTYEDNGLRVYGEGMTSYEPLSQTSAAFEGPARVNGIHGYQYTVEVHDNTPAGSKDWFRIAVTSPTSGYAYTASGPVVGGAIELHLD